MTKRSRRTKEQTAAAPKIKTETRLAPPSITFRIAGYQNAKDTIKSRKSGKEDPGGRHQVKRSTVFHNEIFVECPLEVGTPMIVEATRQKKIIGGGEARFIKEVVGCPSLLLPATFTFTFTFTLLLPFACCHLLFAFCQFGSLNFRASRFMFPCPLFLPLLPCLPYTFPNGGIVCGRPFQ